MPVTVSVFGKTDVGRTREHNEDAFIVADLTTDNATLQPEVRTHAVGPRGTLFMVADGMGGAAAGEIASAMAIETVLEELRDRWMQRDTQDPEDFAAALRDACLAANARIHRFALEHPEHRGMGSTATVCGLLGDRLFLAQVGDSRAYLIRHGTAIQLTKDQSLVQKLVEAGELTAEEAEISERRNIILQALGPDPRVKVDLTAQLVRRGDLLVVCSDGLSGQVRPDVIARTAAAEPDPFALCQRLIDLANESGGPDNITVIAARLGGDDLAEPDGADPVGHQVFRFSGRRDTIAVGDDTPTPPMGVQALTPDAPVATVADPAAPVGFTSGARAAVKPPAGAPPAAPPRPRDATPLYLAIAILGVLLAAWLAWTWRR